MVHYQGKSLHIYLDDTTSAGAHDCYRFVAEILRGYAQYLREQKDHNASWLERLGKEIDKALANPVIDFNVIEALTFTPKKT